LRQRTKNEERRTKNEERRTKNQLIAYGGALLIGAMGTVKPVFEKVPVAQWESFHCEVVRGPDYGTRWHFHPEYQLTLAIKGQGHRLVGDHLGALTDGDVVFVGANLPHVWHQAADAVEGVHAIIVRFDESFVGAEFMSKPEMVEVARLLKRAVRGFALHGAARQEVAGRLERLAEQRGLQRLVELLAILARLAEAAPEELEVLASPAYEPSLRTGDQDRMERVCAYLHRHYTEKIERRELAALAHLSEGAFSRFFSSRTGRTVPQYVNELRVGRACRLLLEQGERTVSDIALDCGFENLANFNRRFLSAKGLSPSAFRRQSRATAHNRS
jgi:AraC-like DNA-binding protein